MKMLVDHNIPVIAVIKKTRSDKGFRAEVLRILPLVSNTVRVRAIDEELDEGIILPAMELKDLVDLTMQVVPEGLKRAFTAAQKVDIELKKHNLMESLQGQRLVRQELPPYRFHFLMQLVLCQFK